MLTVLLVILTAGAIGCWAESQKQVSGQFWMVVTMAVWVICWVLLLLSRRSALLPAGDGVLFSFGGAGLLPALSLTLVDLGTCVISAGVAMVLLSNIPDRGQGELTAEQWESA